MTALRERTYPADPAAAALSLFLQWFGAHYARSTALLGTAAPAEGVISATVSVGRRWDMAVVVANTLAADATLAFEAARAAVEQRLDRAALSVALWLPRDAQLPLAEPALSTLALAVEVARPVDAGRREMVVPVPLYLRRVSNTGSVVTVLGGLSAHWAQFTNRVPGSFQLNALELHRLPASEDERAALAERIVLAAGQPEADESQVIPADDAWTVTDLPGGRSAVIGTPRPDNDSGAAALRRNLRALLRQAAAARDIDASAHALVVLGAATYAEEEKLSWAMRGMDPTLYAGFDIIAVVADGLVRPLLQPQPRVLPWDAPLG